MYASNNSLDEWMEVMKSPHINTLDDLPEAHAG